MDRSAEGLCLALVLLVAGCVSPEAALESSSPAVSPAVSSSSSAVATSIPSPSAATTIEGCAEQRLTAGRCDRIVAWALKEAGLAADLAVRAQFLPPPSCGTQDGKPVVCVRSGGPPITVRLMTPDGRTIDKTLPCGGIPGPAAICWPDPLPLEARDLSGYWDVPCAGPGPAQGCATPVVPDAVALAQARPLRIAALDVPVGPVGHRELEIGRAVLPNGILSKATFAIADEAQRGFVIDPIVIQLVVRSTDSARPPFTGLYQRGRFPGVEEVRVLFAFDVVETSPGAVIHVRDVDVH